MKRYLRLFVTLFVAISLLVVSISCDDNNNNDDIVDNSLFDIKSPYDGINWDTYEQYKAAMHVHTTNSDGSRTLEEVVNEHYRLGYDIVGITDHVWKRTDGVDQYLNLITHDWTRTEWPRLGGGNPVPLTFISQEKLDQIQAGTYPIPERISASTSLPSVESRNGRGMLMIPNSAELALSHGEDEMNVFFFGNDTAPTAWTQTLRNAIGIANNAGAVSFLNHPGRYTRGMDHMGAADAATNPSNNPTFIRRYANLYMEYFDSGLVGMEVFNRRDLDSRQDRVLWDNVLTLTVPEGRMVWGYGNDDSHNHSGIYYNYNVFVMPENTLENFRNAMLDGHSYIVTVTAYNEGVLGTNTDIIPRPVINSVLVDKEAYTITINAENATRILWISEGRNLLTTQGDTGTLQLTHEDIIDRVGSYVRANIIGDGGMATIQPIGTTRK